MQMYEVSSLISNLYRRNKESWEQTRLISYLIALSNSTKKINMNDLISFPWDENENKTDKSISNYDIQRLREKAHKYINNK